MTGSNIGLMDAISAKMRYLDDRQKVLAQNVANADTPNYQAHDLTKVDFAGMLSNILKDGANLRPAQTDPSHMGPPDETATANDKAQKKSYEVAPGGNAVILEEQMVKAAQTTTDFNLMTSLYEKNVAMLRTAIDRGQRLQKSLFDHRVT